jgi:hypothetical protein
VSPLRLWSTTASAATSATFASISALFATPEDVVIRIARTEINGTNGVITSTTFGRKVCNRAPRITGTMTISVIDSMRDPVGTLIIDPAKNVNISGVRSGDRRVFTVDSVIDSAESPRDRYVITFEATPDGQHPTRISPTASGVGKESRCAIPNATNGMIKYRKSTPQNTSNGRVKTNRKSSNETVNPIESITAMMQ